MKNLIKMITVSLIMIFSQDGIYCQSSCFPGEDSEYKNVAIATLYGLSGGEATVGYYYIEGKDNNFRVDWSSFENTTYAPDEVMMQLLLFNIVEFTSPHAPIPPFHVDFITKKDCKAFIKTYVELEQTNTIL